jgi:hypothetical protein
MLNFSAMCRRSDAGPRINERNRAREATGSNQGFIPGGII